MRKIIIACLLLISPVSQADTTIGIINETVSQAKARWAEGQASLAAAATWSAVKAGSPGALKKLEAIAQGGDPTALNMMGWLYDNGAYGVRTNPQSAARFFRTAAERGSEVAIYNIGAIAFHGRGVPKDEAVAYAWFSRAAQSKTIHRACVRAAVLGAARKASANEIESYIQCATDHGNATGFFLRGRREYQSGNFDAAATWLTKAANAMEPNAPWLLSRLYSQSPGLKPDNVIAAGWWAIGARLNPKRPGINATGLNTFSLTDAERQRANHFAEQWISTRKLAAPINYAKTILDPRE